MMKSTLFRFFIVVSLLLTTINVEAKKYHFEIRPMGKTEALIPADSQAFLACPIFAGGTIDCFPNNTRAIVADFDNEKAVEKALHDMKTYFAEHPLEGEYTISAGDLQAKKLIGYATDIRHNSATHDALVNEAKSWGKALLFALLTVVFGFLTLILFTTNRVKFLSRIGGIATGILTLIFGILAIVAIAALAFKYICIILGCAIALIALFAVLGSFFKTQGRKEKERSEQKGWTVNGTVYATKDAADEVAARTGSQVHYKG